MQRRLERPQLRIMLLGLAALAAVILLRQVLWELLLQLAAAGILTALALPLVRLLEKHVRPGAAAALALAALGLGAAGVLLLLIPPLVRQFGQLSDALPALLTWGGEQLARVQALLARRGIDVQPMQERFLAQLQETAAAAVTLVAGKVRVTVSAVSRLFLAPLFAYYLLRDRRRLSAALTLAFPVPVRARAVRAAREMRRETVGFLRGQLMLSGFVGALTAVGLLLVGTPGWLVLGLLMGVLELVPYIGPFIAGIPAVLFALQRGLGQALWTLGVIVAVQQVEGTFLSPRLLSGATRLHPLAVLLSISAGGLIGGTWGMLLALPAVVSVRGALRGMRG